MISIRISEPSALNTSSPSSNDFIYSMLISRISFFAAAASAPFWKLPYLLSDLPFIIRTAVHPDYGPQLHKAAAGPAHAFLQHITLFADGEPVFI